MLPTLFGYLKPVKRFFINLCLIILFFVAALYLGIYLRTNNLLLQTVKAQAYSHFDLIATTRLWNAQYDGVYVEKKGAVESNPYLKELGIEPDIKCEDNRVFTMRNPAMMTREISALIGERSGVRFHITSQKPVNPGNVPDEFERQAFQQFEKGTKEVWGVDEAGGVSEFRYVRPLYIEQSCLACHKTLGDKVGDIRGAISINIPFHRLNQEMKINRIIVIFLSVVTVGTLLSILYFMVWRLVKRLDVAQEQLREMSITDELTQIKNRRYIMDDLHDEFLRTKRLGTSLGVIMLDIDHFKRINDSYGHPFGDIVLKTIAARIKENLRKYDVVGRFGGEEFLVVSPEISFDDVTRLAERIREVVKAKNIGEGSTEVAVTLSAGVTIINEQDIRTDSLISRADNALYKAKQDGRDRVVALRS